MRRHANCCHQLLLLLLLQMPFTTLYSIVCLSRSTGESINYSQTVGRSVVLHGAQRCRYSLNSTFLVRRLQWCNRSCATLTMVMRQFSTVQQLYLTAVTAQRLLLSLLLLIQMPSASIASADNSTSISSITTADLTESSSSNSDVLTTNQLGNVYYVIDHVTSTTSGHNLDSIQSDILATPFVPHRQFLNSILAAAVELTTPSVFDVLQVKNDSSPVNGADTTSTFTSALSVGVSDSSSTAITPLNNTDVTAGTQIINTVSVVREVNTDIVNYSIEPKEDEQSNVTVINDEVMTTTPQRLVAAGPSAKAISEDNTTVQPAVSPVARDDLEKVSVKVKPATTPPDYMQLLQHRHFIDKDRSLSTFDVHRILWKDQPYVVLLSALTGMSISMLMIFTVYWFRQCTHSGLGLLSARYNVKKYGWSCCRLNDSDDQEAALLVDT